MKLQKSKLAAIGAALACVATFPFIAQAQAGGGAPTDPQILGIVVTANQIDIDHAKLARSSRNNRELRDFAQQMITNHSALQKAVGDLGTKLNVKPAHSDTGTP